MGGNWGPALRDGVNLARPDVPGPLSILMCCKDFFDPVLEPDRFTRYHAGHGGITTMSDFIINHGSEIISAVIGAIVGASISIPITIRSTRNSMSGSSNSVNQSGARAGGDVVGRDKKTH